MLPRGVNPFVRTGSVGPVDCTDCPFWNARSGHCTISPNEARPCGRPPDRQQKAEIGRVFGK